MKEDDRKRQEEGTATHQLQKAPVQGARCPQRIVTKPLDTARCKPEKTPGECAPSKQWSKKKKKKKQNQWSKPKKNKMQDLRNRECKSKGGKGNSQGQRRGRSRDNMAAGLGTSCPDRTEVSRSKVSEKPAETDALSDESNLEGNYSERLLVDTKKITATKLSKTRQLLTSGEKMKHNHNKAVSCKYYSNRCTVEVRNRFKGLDGKIHKTYTLLSKCL